MTINSGDHIRRVTLCIAAMPGSQYVLLRFLRLPPYSTVKLKTLITRKLPGGSSRRRGGDLPDPNAGCGAAGVQQAGVPRHGRTASARWRRTDGGEMGAKAAGGKGREDKPGASAGVVPLETARGAARVQRRHSRVAAGRAPVGAGAGRGARAVGEGAPVGAPAAPRSGDAARSLPAPKTADRALPGGQDRVQPVVQSS